MPARIAAAGRFRAGMQRFAAARPIHGECGGFMVLGKTLEDADGKTHEMLGLLGHATSFAKRRMNLGYRQARLRADCPLGAAGETIRGHEFHYAQIDRAGRRRTARRHLGRSGPAARRVRRPPRQRHRHILPRDRQGLNEMAEADTQ